MKYLILQRPPFGEQVLGVFAGASPGPAFQKAAAQTGISGRLVAFALDDAIQADVTITPAAPTPPAVDVQLVLPGS